MSGRLVAAMLVAVAAIVGYLVLGGSDDRYLVKLEMANAGGLRNGANVRVAGAPAGRVTKIELNDEDLAVAELRLEPGITPIGAGARAVIDTDGIFGERFVSIDRGDLSDPQASGSTIPPSRAMVSVRLDDVIDTLDLDTRQALGVFINEQGMAIAGRGRELEQVLAALPPSLQQTAALLDQLAEDNTALGRLVESSDRVVAGIARERVNFGRVFGAFGETLQTLDGRRAELAETVRQAPATLRSARRTLVSLQAASLPLIPAARGLRSTAAPLTSTLLELPGFAAAAAPALDTAIRVAPDLERLATRATPVVRELRPFARGLSAYTGSALNPFTRLLDMGTADLFGLMEGWARSTQGRDAASHIFRFGATSGSDTFAALLNPPDPTRGGRTPERKWDPQEPGRVPPAVEQLLPGVKLPGAPDLQKTIDDLLSGKAKKPVTDLTDEVVGDVGDLPQPLLDYLLGG